ncbi:hypothetical protein EYF80_051098 [Liparis tanakae]|uniref:Uncharacterized protein n=1 Tax=Liparis tanakae TaxID=230148 RepID=A0A4Z2FEB0_9TELE|nr:hypothetical protein EYF80_051098 [Liparis tanakae]
MTSSDTEERSFPPSPYRTAENKQQHFYYPDPMVLVLLFYPDHMVLVLLFYPDPMVLVLLFYPDHMVLVLLVYPDPMVLVLLAYPDHVLADPHQLVVQLRIHHLHLLQLEDPLVAALSQLTLVLLQTLDDLQG